MKQGGRGARAAARAAMTVAVLAALASATRGEEARETELRELGLLARVVDEPDPGLAREERKSGIPGFEVRSDEKVFGQAKVARPWLLELRVKGGAIELVAANDSRTDFSIEAVEIDCDGLSATIEKMPRSLSSNALEATRLARMVPQATTPRSCAGRITSDNGVTSQLKIQFTPLLGGQAPERRPR